MRKLLLGLVVLAGLAGCGSDAHVLAGRWQGAVVLGAWEGTTIVQHFDPGAAYTLTVGSTDFTGTWSVADDVLTISDGSCTTMDPGMWQLKWVDDATYVYHIVSDACPSRGEALNGITMTQPYDG
jgi:hypothetical protein